MILITGASGKTGRAVTAVLAQRGMKVRAMVRREPQIAETLAVGATEAIIGDVQSRADLKHALAGTDAVYHICPNVNPNEAAIGADLIQAACDTGVERVVYHSVLHPQVEAMPHHWQKMRVEEALFASGLDFTILQPAAYMQNTLGQLNTMKSKGIYYSPYNTAIRMSMVDLEDVAEAAAEVLTGVTHSRAVYELCGVELLSQDEVATAYSRALGIPIRAEEQNRDEWEANARRAGMADYAVETLLKMFVYYDQHGLAGNANVLTWLLGRKPADFAAFLSSALHRQTD